MVCLAVKILEKFGEINLELLPLRYPFGDEFLSIIRDLKSLVDATDTFVVKTLIKLSMWAQETCSNQKVWCTKKKTLKHNVMKTNQGILFVAQGVCIAKKQTTAVAAVANEERASEEGETRA